MTVLLAPDKFKGSLSAREVCAALAAGVRRVYPEAEIIERPLADGGEGSLEVLREVLPLHVHRLEVTGPLRRRVAAEYLLGEGKAFIETARACGLQHVPPGRRDPGITTTIGVGELVEDAVVRGAREVYLFLGGSATNDCGAGMAGALGYRFWSDRGHDFIPTGNSLGYTRRIDPSEVMAALDQITFVGVCDVDNPLLGPTGATMVYARQKGAETADLLTLEEHIIHFADLLQRDLGYDTAGVPGAGAAGGLGAACLAFLNGSLRSGIEVLLETVGFSRLLERADLVITGEGKIDEQTPRGKVVAGVGKAAAAAGVPVIALGGIRTVGAAELPFLTDLRAIRDDPAVSFERAMAEAGELLAALAIGSLRDFRAQTK